MDLGSAWGWLGRPRPPPPQQRGFGTKLIEGGIAAELGGTATLAFSPDGLRCAIDIPFEAAALGSRPGAAADWSI
jgi:two-component sensor histidine kinase